MVLGMGLVGGAIGGLVVMPFVSRPKNGENFFNAIWLCIGLTVMSFLLVTFILPRDPKKETKDKAEEDGVETPKFLKKIIIITIIASALDSAGDEGTRMARGTIMTNVFPEWATIERQNQLMMAVLGVLICSAIVLELFKKCLNLPAIAVVGCAFTLSVQLILLIEWDDVPFIVIWHVGKLFGFLSTIASGFIIQAVAPKELIGYWSGRNEAMTNIAMAVAPLIFATMYDEIGNKRGQEMLMATSVISFLATCAYIPLIKMMPPPPKPAGSVELKELECYEKMTDLEFNQLELEIIDELARKMVEKGLPPRIVSWGSYEEERCSGSLDSLHKRAINDFRYCNGQVVQMLSNRKFMIDQQSEYKQYQDLTTPEDKAKADVERIKAKQEMGAWLGDYFDDAGYVDWDKQCQMFKSMLMTAFPPIDALNASRPDFGSMAPQDMEEHLVRFMAVLDNYIATEQRRLGDWQASTSAKQLIKRR